MPMTGPRPAARHAFAISARTRVLPAPAGALITDTRRPSVSTDSAAAAWSSRSPEPVPRRLRRVPRRPLLRPARARAARDPRRARPRRPRGSCAARSRPAPARPCAPPSTTARAWRSGRRRGGGTRCGRPRGPGRPAGRPGRAPPGTGPASNSERRIRSAVSSSSLAAASGSRPVRGRTRPRYLTRSARVHADFSCCASASARCAARAQREVPGTASRESPSAPRACVRLVCVGAVRVGVPDRRGNRRERDAERAREPVRPARVRLR